MSAQNIKQTAIGTLLMPDVRVPAVFVLVLSLIIVTVLTGTGSPG